MIDTRQRVAAVVVALLLASSVLAGLPIAGADTPDSDIDRQNPATVAIADRLQSAEGEVTVIARLETPAVMSSTDGMSTKQRLKSHAERSQSDLMAFADRAPGVDVVQRFWLGNAVLLEVNTSRTGLVEVASTQGVEQIHPNYEFEIPARMSGSTDGGGFGQTVDQLASSDGHAYGLEQLSVPDVWEDFGTKGGRMKVAVLDTGVQADHPAKELYTRDESDPTYPGGWAEFDENGDRVSRSEPHDTGWHGTHTSETVGGQNVSGVPAFGIAPNAKLMPGLVLPGGNGTFAQIIGGMQWAVEEDADVVNLSVGTLLDPNSDVDLPVSSYLIDPIRDARAAGTYVVVSSGNEGNETITSPGGIYDATSIGASDSNREIATVSSGGVVVPTDVRKEPPSDWPSEYAYPDVSAPGVSILSLVPDGDPIVASVYVDVIVEFTNSSAREAATIPPGVSVTGGRNVSFMPVLFMKGPKPAIAALEDQTGVVAVRRNAEVAVKPPQGTETTISVTGQRATENQLVPWGVDRIAARTARAAVSDDAIGAVDVAVLDTGIDYTHEDLETVTWGANFSNGVSAYGRSRALDNHGHGTAIAGVVAAANDRSDVVGVAPGVDLYAIKVMNRSGVGRLSWVINGIDASLKGDDGELGTDDDAEVLLLSLGSSEGTKSMRDAIDAASEYAVVVAAAGNSGDGNVSTNEVDYPARYDGAIAVAATDWSDETPRFSAEGEAVELAAPGVDITTTRLGGGTTALSGTSLAAPHVAGTAALVIAQDIADGKQDRSPSDVRTRLRETAMDIEAEGVDKESGYGLVNATAALGVQPSEPATFSIEDLSPESVSIVRGESVDVSATITNRGGVSGTETIALRLDGSIVAERTVTLGASESETVAIENVFSDIKPGRYEYGLYTASESRTALLTVQQPARFVVSDLSPGNVSISPGDTMTIKGSIENTGGVAGTQVVSIWFDGETLTERELQLSPGETQIATVSGVKTNTLETGSYSYGVTTVNDSRSSTVRIRHFDVDSTVPGRIVPGKNATMTYAVTNRDNETIQNVSLTVQTDSEGATVRPTNLSLSDGLPTGESWNTNVTLALDRNTSEGTVRITTVVKYDNDTVSTNATIPISRTDVVLYAPNQITTTPGSSVNVTYTMENTGYTQPSAGGIFLTSTTSPLSVNGSDAVFLGFGSPVPEPGESIERSFTIDVPASTAPGRYEISGQGNLGTEIKYSTNTTIVVRGGIERFDQNEPYGEIGFQDVLDAISAYNGDEKIGGAPVDFRDVLDVIDAYNERN